MPKPTPLPASLRDQIAIEIQYGAGRNDIARRYSVSAGVVSKIARERDLTFPRADMTASATECHRIDVAAWRIQRERDLLNEQNTALSENRQRAARRIDKQLHDLHRHHNGDPI